MNEQKQVILIKQSENGSEKKALFEINEGSKVKSNIQRFGNEQQGMIRLAYQFTLQDKLQIKMAVSIPNTFSNLSVKMKIGSRDFQLVSEGTKNKGNVNVHFYEANLDKQLVRVGTIYTIDITSEIPPQGYILPGTYVDRITVHDVHWN